MNEHEVVEEIRRLRDIIKHQRRELASKTYPGLHISMRIWALVFFAIFVGGALELHGYAIIGSLILGPPAFVSSLSVADSFVCWRGRKRRQRLRVELALNEARLRELDRIGGLVLTGYTFGRQGDITGWYECEQALKDWGRP